MPGNLFHLQVQFILFLQSLGDWLVAPMQFFSFLGREEFFLLFMPALYWCIDAVLGLRVGIILLLSNGLSEVLKKMLHGPRPYFYSPEIHAFSTETSFGAPSGHAMIGASVWGLVAASLKRRWAWLIVAILVSLIGLSRVFLGVHFPVDVLFGWLVGALLVWAYIRLESSVAEWMRQKSTGWQVITVFGVSLLILLLGVLARLSLGAWAIPTDWLENAARAAPGSDPPDPLALAGLVLNAGAFFGLVTGYILLLTAGGFDAQGQWWKRLLRFPIGVLGVVLLWLGLGAVFPSGEYLLAYVLRYLRYALIGAWISALAPLIFIRLGLAKAANPRLVWKFRDGWREYSDR